MVNLSCSSGSLLGAISKVSTVGFRYTKSQKAQRVWKHSKRRGGPLHRPGHRAEPDARPSGLHSEAWPLWLVFPALSTGEQHTDGSKGVKRKILECFPNGGEKLRGGWAPS